MPDPMSYNARAMKELSEAIALSRQVATEGASLPEGCPRELELRKIAAEIGAMITALGQDLGIDPADLIQMVRAPHQYPARLN